MDPQLAQLAIGDRVWVICERHRLAQRGEIVGADAVSLTVRLPNSLIDPQPYDKVTGMWIVGDKARSNTFFIRNALPHRFTNKLARPEYLVMNTLEDPSASS